MIRKSLAVSLLAVLMSSGSAIAQEISVSPYALRQFRSISTTSFAKYGASDYLIADTIEKICYGFKNGKTEADLVQIQVAAMIKMNETDRRAAKDYFSSANAIAMGLVCPDLAEGKRLPRD